ncbi:hypothetical protein DPMN_137331 [Dreissena polymorpha]|uniref:Uncharacterized protein n=1 Tax=Dreissena polymorpha TaxID=45954 RepID=A0A9D4JGC0_DREPO|nr:hypothetical protein DPMN_137331 [Dreissena polymorpha]
MDNKIALNNQYRQPSWTLPAPFRDDYRVLYSVRSSVRLHRLHSRPVDSKDCYDPGVQIRDGLLG